MVALFVFQTYVAGKKRILMGMELKWVLPWCFLHRFARCLLTNAHVVADASYVEVHFLTEGWFFMVFHS